MTRREWFQEKYPEQFERILECSKKHYDGYDYMNEEVDNMTSLQYAFVWAETSEGMQYWEKLHYGVRNV